MYLAKLYLARHQDILPKINLSHYKYVLGDRVLLFIPFKIPVVTSLNGFRFSSGSRGLWLSIGLNCVAISPIIQKMSHMKYKCHFLQLSDIFSVIVFWRTYLLKYLTYLHEMTWVGKRNIFFKNQNYFIEVSCKTPKISTQK